MSCVHVSCFVTEPEHAYKSSATKVTKIWRDRQTDIHSHKLLYSTDILFTIQSITNHSLLKVIILSSMSVCLSLTGLSGWLASKLVNIAQTGFVHTLKVMFHLSRVTSMDNVSFKHVMNGTPIHDKRVPSNTVSSNLCRKHSSTL